MKTDQVWCIPRMWSIRCVASDKADYKAVGGPDYASVDEAICAALPLLMPFIKRTYQAMKERERQSRAASGRATPRPEPRQPRGKRKQ